MDISRHSDTIDTQESSAARRLNVGYAFDELNRVVVYMDLQQWHQDLNRAGQL